MLKGRGAGIRYHVNSRRVVFQIGKVRTLS